MRPRRVRRVKARTVEFCERCGQVCNARCRSDHLLERAKTRALGVPGMLR